jgi:hypothetical protein
MKNMKLIPKTILNYSVLLMPLALMGILAISQCGDHINVKLPPFELQITKGSCK